MRGKDDFLLEILGFLFLVKIVIAIFKAAKRVCGFRLWRGGNMLGDGVLWRGRVTTNVQPLFDIIVSLNSVFIWIWVQLVNYIFATIKGSLILCRQVVFWEKYIF